MDSKTFDRRSFLLSALKASGQLVLASTSVYTVGSFVKTTLPDAGMLAGAKSCGWTSTFGGVESACTIGRCDPIPDCDIGFNGNSWSGCTSCGSTNGIYETLQCGCN